MRKTSIQTRIIVPFVLLMVIIFSVTAFAGAQAVASTIENQARARISTLAEFISGAGFPLTQGTLKSMGELLDVGLATVDEDYHVRQTNLLPELAGALPRTLRDSVEPGEATSVFYFKAAGRDFYAAFASVNRGKDRGLVLLYDAESVRAAQWKSVWPILAAAFAAVLLANLSGWYIARSITKPLRKLASSSAQVASGDLATRISIETGDELEQLADDFNHMVDSLRTSREELLQKEKLATLGTVAAGIAHEIRNPLTSIKMFAQMLSAGTQNEEDRENLDILLNEIERLQLTTGALLDYAKPSEKHSGEAQAIGTVEEVLKLMQRQLAHHKVEVNRTLPETPLKAKIEANRLKQIIFNLILNSIDAMPEGGRMEIAVRDENGTIQLSVSDTGKGIQESDLDKVFDPFYSTHPGGWGLGLAISKRFAEDAGGAISAESGPEGTTFTVMLPAA